MAKSASTAAKPSTVSTGPSDLVASLSLFFGTLVLYVALANYNLEVIVNDTYFTSYPAWSLGEQGTLNIYGNPVTTGWYVQLDPTDVRSDRFPGAILIAVPFYWLLGTANFSIAPAVVSAAVCSAVGVLFLFRALLRLTTVRVALASACVFAFGTSMFTVASDSPWTHAVTVTGLAIGTWAMSRGSYWGAGLGYAFAILGRPHTAVVAAVTGIWESVHRRSPGPMLKVGVASALGVIGLLIYNQLNIGEWTLLPGSYAGRDVAAVDISSGSGQAQAGLWGGDLLAVLFSPLRGVFVYSPFLLLLLPGIPRAWRIAPAWVRSSAVGGLVYLVIQLAGNTWTGGEGFFGYRITLETLFLTVPLLTLAWVEWTSQKAWRRRSMAVLTGLSLWWFAMAAGGYELLWEQFLNWQHWEVPRLIELTSPGGPLIAAVFVALLAWLVLPLDHGRRPEIHVEGLSVDRGDVPSGQSGRTKSAPSEGTSTKTSTSKPAVTEGGAKKGSTAKKRTRSGKTG